MSDALAPFAEISAATLSATPTVAGQRLLVALSVRIEPDVIDAYEDRRLVGLQLTALDGDLSLETPGGPALICGLRAGSPLPVSSGAEAREEALLLFADLDAAGWRALVAAAGDAPRFQVTVRGQLTRWTNPLFDAQGYQHTRVGDKGMSRVVQDMGSQRAEPVGGVVAIGAVDLG